LPGGHTYRRDIDGLRGIAILAVLVFHFWPSVARGGFVGVDVFFVISGFLITSILIEGIGLKEFYIRRAKRLLPALIIALAITLALGLFLLLPDEFEVLGRNVLAAATFTTNFVLIHDHNAAGYFTNLAQNNELTHLWSLSIEEQYYLIWPLTFGLISRRWRLFAGTIILLFFIASDFCNVGGLTNDRYYFPGTRFWEILAGSWLAIVAAQESMTPRFNAVAGIAKACGLALVLFSIFGLQPDKGWPGPMALIPVTGAMIFIAFRATDSFAGRLTSSSVLVWIGLISYPLYLYHWILLSYAQLTYRGELPEAASWLLLALSILLAALTYRFIETPVRRGKYGAARFALVPAALASLFFIALGVYLSGGLYWRYSDIVAFNDLQKSGEKIQLFESCLKRFGDLVPAAIGKDPDRRYFCADGSDDPHPVIIIGDSHAQKLYYGFLGLNVRNVVHFGKGSCAPIWNLNPVHDPWYNCQPDVNRFIEYAARADAPLAILTGVFERYFDGTYVLGKSEAEIEDDIEQWFRVLSRSQHKIVVVLDNPSLPFEPKECMERPIDLNRRIDCTFDRKIYDGKAAAYKALFRKKAAVAANVTLVDASQFFCDNEKCHAENADGMTYTGDNNHLSMRGAKIVDQEILRLLPSAFKDDGLSRAIPPRG
jgi:peptidoglycan/LPS O-acetylase OafA/YrhL